MPFLKSQTIFESVNLTNLLKYRTLISHDNPWIQFFLFWLFRFLQNFQFSLVFQPLEANKRTIRDEKFAPVSCLLLKFRIMLSATWRTIQLLQNKWWFIDGWILSDLKCFQGYRSERWVSVTHFFPLFPFHYTWKRQKIVGINPVNMYLFKVNNRNITTMCETWLKLTTKSAERRHWFYYSLLWCLTSKLLFEFL